MKRFLKFILATVLRLEARLILLKYRPRVVAITGSVGKTSAKNAINAVLSPSLRVRASEKSYNSEIGIPLTILGRENAWMNVVGWLSNLWHGVRLITSKSSGYPAWLVLEVGADRPGDISSLAKLIRPDIAVFTRFADVPVHIEFFGSRDELITEKKSLAEHLRSDGSLVLNVDDPEVYALAQQTRARYVTVGIAGKADFVASNIELSFTHDVDGVDRVNGISFKVSHEGNCLPVQRKGVIGVQHVMPSLAAMAVAEIAGLNLIAATSSLGELVSEPGRMRILRGIKGTTIIDDSYNSSPVAVREALNALGEMRKNGGRRIAVLGDMMELGRYSAAEHRTEGERAADVADILVTVGVRSRATADAALDAGMADDSIFQFEEAREAGKFIEGILRKRDIVLVKGSQSIRMERVVKEIMAEPERSEELLVRQDKEWIKR